MYRMSPVVINLPKLLKTIQNFQYSFLASTTPLTSLSDFDIKTAITECQLNWKGGKKVSK